MSIIDHGTWTSYTPGSLPEGFPSSALFARRESDGTDWYDYLYPDQSAHFQPGVVKATVREREPGIWAISAPTKDASALFPASHSVIELPDYATSNSGAALIDELINRIVDMTTGAVGEVYAPPPMQDPVLTDILKRLDALEAKGT